MISCYSKAILIRKANKVERGMYINMRDVVKENLYSSFLFASPKALQRKHHLMPLSGPFL